jgi:hypothetical protein
MLLRADLGNPSFQGPMLRFFKYFRRKIQQKMTLLTQNKAEICKILIITLVFEKTANFFAENCKKNRRKSLS